MARRAGRITQVIVSLLVLAAAVWIFFNHQYVADRITVWQYSPSAEVAALTGRAQFADDGKFYFYASRPSLSNREEFNQHCTSQEEHAVILGCYVNRQIFVFDVDDERLDGVREVTAAHEMLHAAYDRLSTNERERVGTLLEAELEAADEALLERLRVYSSLSARDRVNELHSIIGTEVDEISPELEAYYTRYFENRQVIVDMFHSYESVFRDLREQQEALVGELNDLVAQINTRTAAYNQSIVSLNAQIVSFNARAGQPGGFASEAEFDATRNNLLAEQEALEHERAAIEGMRQQYSEKVAMLDELNLQQQSLQQSLDSTPSPVPSI